MLPMLCFLGKDAFKDGVFVYDASLTADNHFVNAGSYKDIQAAMFAELANMTDKIDEKKDNSDWLIEKVSSLKSTAEFVNRYHTSVLNIDLEIIEDLLREMAKNKKHIDRPLAVRIKDANQIKKPVGDSNIVEPLFVRYTDIYTNTSRSKKDYSIVENVEDNTDNAKSKPVSVKNQIEQRQKIPLRSAFGGVRRNI